MRSIAPHRACIFVAAAVAAVAVLAPIGSARAEGGDAAQPAAKSRPAKSQPAAKTQPVAKSQAPPAAKSQAPPAAKSQAPPAAKSEAPAAAKSQPAQPPVESQPAAKTQPAAKLRPQPKRQPKSQRPPTSVATAAAAPPIPVAPIRVRAGRASRAGVGDLVGPAPGVAGGERALDESAFVTVARVADRAGEKASVADLLASELGVHVRSLGGLGAFSSLSVRGASPGQTAVLVDGVPLSTVASVTADLGDYDLGALSELDLYRGGAPARFGGAVMGGALDLITAVGPAPGGHRLRLGAGFGSFGARDVRARWGDRALAGHLAYVASAGYAGADGDFPYFDDNGTNLNPNDDSVVRRANNGYDQGNALLRLRYRRGDLSLAGGGRWLLKSQGVPGSESDQSHSAHLSTVSQVASARATLRHLFGVPALVGSASMYSIVERQRYEDLADEIGVGAQNRRYLTVAGGGSARVRYALGDRQLVSLDLDLRADTFHEDELGGDGASAFSAEGARYAAGASATDEIAVLADRLVLAPAVRLDFQRTDPIDDHRTSPAGPMTLSPRNDIYPSPRISARLRVAPSLSFKANAGFYFRAPTVVELFGDRGFVVGNPTLRGETGTSGDAGAVFAPARRFGPIDRLYVEAAVFGAQSHHVIAFVPSAGLAAVAQNLGDADRYGAEIGAAVRIARTATLTANYTFLHTRQSSPIPSYDGKALPHRPRHELYARLDLARRLAGRLAVLWGDAHLVAGNFLDPANLSPVPARNLFGAGLKFEPMRNLLVGIEVKNLTDERVELIPLKPPPRPGLTSYPRPIADFFGYPLPGRSLYATLQWER